MCLKGITLDVVSLIPQLCITGDLDYCAGMVLCSANTSVPFFWFKFQFIELPGKYVVTILIPFY